MTKYFCSLAKLLVYIILSTILLEMSKRDKGTVNLACRKHHLGVKKMILLSKCSIYIHG